MKFAFVKMQKFYLLSLILVVIAVTNSQKCSQYYEPNVEDCSRYSKCNQTTNTVINLFCPYGLFFNTITQKCEKPSNVKCQSKVLNFWKTKDFFN